MKNIKDIRVNQIMPLPAALITGMGLFLLIRYLEGLLKGSLLVNAVGEEGVKLLLFPLFLAGIKLLKDYVSEDTLRRAGFFLYPFFCIIGFAVLENIFYFLRFPNSSIYQRLIYAYPIHVNTGLLYALGFMLRKPLLTGFFFLLGIAYHFGLNTFSFIISDTAVYGIGVANLMFFYFLFCKLRDALVTRSLQNVGR